MTTYIGTKLVKLLPMSRQEYNDYRGWTLPAGEDGADLGYLVEYTDGGKPNDPRHPGYISWSPKAQAEMAYRKVDGLSFGLAIEAMKMGHPVARAGWNGKGMWLIFVPTFEDAQVGGQTLPLRPWIAMKTVNHELVPWTASQSDVLADDWSVVEALAEG